MSLSLQHKFTAITGGSTGCDKTNFVFRLIVNAYQMIDPPPSQIWYCYGEFQPLFRQYPRVKFHEGLPDVSRFDGRQPVLLITDDLTQESDGTVANLFTKGSHHRNISVIYLTQNLFHKNPRMRTISLNFHYMILFKNPRDAA